jgi:hypothetical protein
MRLPPLTPQYRYKALGLKEMARSYQAIPAYLLVCTSLILLSGCSSSGAHTSESVPLPPAALAVGDECSELADGSGGGAEKAQVYRCKDIGNDGVEKEPFFVTVLRDCTISEKFNHRATTRQLLVGFSHLKVLNQEPIEVGQEKVLRSVVSGILDVDPVFISTFTLRRGSCVTDLVMWKQSNEAKDAIVGTLGSKSVAQSFADATTHLAQKFGEQDLFPSPEINRSPSSSDMNNPERLLTGIPTDIPNKVHHAELPTG